LLTVFHLRKRILRWIWRWLDPAGLRWRDEESTCYPECGQFQNFGAVEKNLPRTHPAAEPITAVLALGPLRPLCAGTSELAIAAAIQPARRGPRIFHKRRTGNAEKAILSLRLRSAIVGSQISDRPRPRSRLRKPSSRRELALLRRAARMSRAISRVDSSAIRRGRW